VLYNLPQYDGHVYNELGFGTPPRTPLLSLAALPHVVLSYHTQELGFGMPPSLFLNRERWSSSAVTPQGRVEVGAMCAGLLLEAHGSRLPRRAGCNSRRCAWAVAPCGARETHPDGSVCVDLDDALLAGSSVGSNTGPLAGFFIFLELFSQIGTAATFVNLYFRRWALWPPLLILSNKCDVFEA
jgi:hypothetical protein